MPQRSWLRGSSPSQFRQLVLSSGRQSEGPFLLPEISPTELDVGTRIPSWLDHYQSQQRRLTSPGTLQYGD